MKGVLVGTIVAALAVFGPQRVQSGPLDALWSVGALLIAAHLLQRLTRLARLPEGVAWLGAGLLLGNSGLQLVRPDQLPALELLRVLAMVWVGFQVGIHFAWPRGLGWRGPVLIGLVTVATLGVIALGIATTTAAPWWLALLIGGIASLWGPFTTVPTPARRGALLLSILGGGFSLLLLSAILGFLRLRGLVPAGAVVLIGTLWLSLAAGALGGEVLQRLGLFRARGSALAAGLFGMLLVAAVAIQHFGLYALPCGFGAGLLLVKQRVPAKRLRYMLRLVSPSAFMLFFALMGATIELDVLWPLVPGLAETLGLMYVALILVRGLGPAVYYPLAAPDSGARMRLGWLLLPRGALLFELVYHSQRSLVGLLGENSARLLHQVALADILIQILVFATLARAMQRLFPPPLLPSPAPASQGPV